MIKQTFFVTTAVLALFSSGCSMADTVTAISPVNEHVKPVDAATASADVAALDAEVTAFLRGRYTIESASYYHFAGEIPWVAIAKSVQNQMREKSIERVVFDWNNPGYDFVEVYPQGKSAFAVAMYTKSSRSKQKLVGYFVLSAAR